MEEQPEPAAQGVVQFAGTTEDLSRALSGLIVELEVEPDEGVDQLTGSFQACKLGELTFFRTATSGGRHVARRSEKLIARSKTNSFYVCQMLGGEALLSQAGHRSVLNPGDLAILDSTREYQIEILSGFEALWIQVPRFRIEGRLSGLRDLMAERISGASGLGRIASAIIRTCFEEAEHMTAADANRVTNAILDVIGMALNRFPASTKITSSYRASILRRIQSYIEENAADPTLSLLRIAQDNQLSVRYLNKLFEREGTSTARWLRIRRLERCRQDLENAEKAGVPIGDIAFSNGFNDIGSFNRVFKTYFGVTPRVMRNKMSVIR